MRFGYWLPVFGGWLRNVADELAVAIGVPTARVNVLDMPMPDGSVVHDHGKFMVLWKRNAKGEWKWHRDIYNSDVAPPAAASPGTTKKDSAR